MMKKCGLLISFEGIDGCGKSTQSKLLKLALSKMGFDVVLLKEPTDGIYGKKIKEILSSGKKSAFLTSQEIYELFIKDREENVRKNIIPALNAGKIVILDRYFISTIAYQGAAGIPINRILNDNLKFPIPDVIFILDIPLKKALKRLERERTSLDNFEKSMSFLKAVRDIYLRMPDILKNTNVIIIDATQDVNAVHNEIMKSVMKILKLKGCI